MAPFVRWFAILLCLFAAPALAERRVALVIGNDAYAHLPPLRKAVNDANAVGDALEGIGFTVVRGQNLSRQGMLDALFDLTERLGEGDTAFVFFAGHGVALAGGNHLLPVDTPAPTGARSEERVRTSALAEADLIAEVRGAGARLAVVVLDACRDNPFKATTTRAIGGTRGLVRPPETRGVFGIYSAGFGETALDRLSDDDPDPNSVFTRVLAPALGEPGLSLVDIAYKVNAEVEALAQTVGHAQSPAHYDQARGRDVVLVTSIAASPGPVRPGAVSPAAPVVVDVCAEAKASFDLAREIGTADAYWTFAETYAACPPYAGYAKAMVAKLGARDQVAAITQPETPAPPKPSSPPLGTLLRTLEGHLGHVSAVAFSVDGQILASGANDGTVKLWRVADGKLLRTLLGDGSNVLSIAFSPDGAALAGGTNDKTVKLWRVADGRLLRTLKGHDDSVTSVTFSPDGKVLASAGDDKTVKLWRVADGRLRRTLEAHGESVRSVAFSPDGAVLASGSDDRTAKLWRVADGSLIRTFEGHGVWVFSVAFSPDGRVLASGSGDKTVKLWSLGPPSALAAQ